jgi:cobyrinic acid a,c-diamide synthase
MAVTSFKAGPDYIDPQFHAAASGRACANLDPWAMRPTTIQRLANEVFTDAEQVIGEGMMGLFDGAADGSGSTADLAHTFGLPVVLVVDAHAQGASVAALVEGFVRHRAEVEIAGVILNRVGSTRHEAMLRRALDGRAVVLGAVSRDEALALPARHLGLVQARENAALDDMLDGAGAHVAKHVDIGRLIACARPPILAEATGHGPSLSPFGQRIAVARDDAFSFAYQDTLDGWRSAGAELSFFSPLADEAPEAQADAVFLPGGYPELHAVRLGGNKRFLAGIHAAAKRDACIYGECGGYMVLGEGVVDAEGARHSMAGLLPISTDFARRRLHLGYREATLMKETPVGAVGARFRGHEFHYASISAENGAQNLFACRDSEGTDLGPAGAVAGRVMGSFIHLIDRMD